MVACNYLQQLRILPMYVATVQLNLNLTCACVCQQRRLRNFDEILASSMQTMYIRIMSNVIYYTSNTVGCRAKNFANFADFLDLHEICFTKNQWKSYDDMDCRLKRKVDSGRLFHQTFILVHLQNLQLLKKGALWQHMCSLSSCASPH